MGKIFYVPFLFSFLGPTRPNMDGAMEMFCHVKSVRSHQPSLCLRDEGKLKMHPNFKYPNDVSNLVLLFESAMKNCLKIQFQN